MHFHAVFVLVGVFAHEIEFAGLMECIGGLAVDD